VPEDRKSHAIAEPQKLKRSARDKKVAPELKHVISKPLGNARLIV
jgi:hypothetical protein